MKTISDRRAWLVRGQLLFAIASCAVSGVYGQVVLDDFSVSNEANYDFIPLTGSPPDGWVVASGQLRPNVATNATAAWLWNQGQTLSSVGDFVSITLYPDGHGNIGLFFAPSLNSTSGYIARALCDGNIVAGVCWAGCAIGNSSPGPFQLTVQMVSQTPTNSSYQATFTGAATTNTSSLTAAATSLYFGPFAQGTAGSAAALGNLTFSGTRGPGTQVITFDDLTTTADHTNYNGSTYYFSMIPSVYAGLTWSNFGVTAGVIDTNSGYQPAVISPKNVAFNWSGNPASIGSAVPFDLISAYLTAAWNDNLQVEVQGYASGVLLYDRAYTLSAVAPTLITFNYLGVDQVSFRATGGTPHAGYSFSDPPYSGGTWFAIDNVAIFSPWRQVIGTQPPLPAYGTCPLPEQGKDGLILVTHGWIPPWDNPAADAAMVDSISNSISQYLTAHNVSNWQVYGYKWINGANVPVPGWALFDAEFEGILLGDAIVSQGAWSHFHFIAHSAGAGLIQKATEQIHASLPNSTIHCTFLDAYDGFFGEKTGEYGSKATWADSYFVRDPLQLAGWTGSPLPNAYNVDVTALDPQASHNQLPGFVSNLDPGAPCYETESSHIWPINFYSNSLMSDLSAVYVGGDYGVFGFKLSEEAGNWASARSLFPPGNGTSGNSTPTMILGPHDPTCTEVLTTSTPLYIGGAPSFEPSSTVTSSTGGIRTFLGSVLLTTDSPAWVVTTITDTNLLNFLSFDVEFTSYIASHGLLTAYWDTNAIGFVDETAIQPGIHHYTLSFPMAPANVSHILGFRLDAFTNLQSAVMLTNIATGFLGVSRPSLLSVTTNGSHGLPVYQSTGQPALYIVQASPDFLTWTNVAILVNTNGAVSFTDPSSTNHPYGFYRVTSPTAVMQ